MKPRPAKDQKCCQAINGQRREKNVDREEASMMRGENDRNVVEEMRSQAREPDLETLDGETRWELVGCIVLLVIAVLMAVAVNFYVP